MSFDLVDYIPNSLVTAVAVIAGWVFRDHAERDDVRFKGVADSLKDLTEKVDASISAQSANHAEILKILIGLRT